MKRVLFCIHKQSPFYLSIPFALRNLGFQVEIFDYYQSNPKVRLLGIANNLFLFDKNRALINHEINKALYETAKKIKPDYLLIIKGLHIENQTIEKIKKLNITCINWFQDLLEFLPWLRQHAYVYDYLFTPDPLMKKSLKRIGIKSYLLPLATNPDRQHHPLVKRYGVVFSGQCTKRREKIFKELTMLGQEFVIWGYPGWKKSSLANHYQGILPTVNSMLDKFRQSKIVINVQTAEDEFPSEVVSLRAFESTGVGTFLLNWRHKAIDNFWEDGKEIINFTSPREAFVKAKYYLNHSKEREDIAFRGWQRTVRDHTYNQRLQEMFKTVTSI